MREFETTAPKSDDLSVRCDDTAVRCDDTASKCEDDNDTRVDNNPFEKNMGITLRKDHSYCMYSTNIQNLTFCDE